MYEGLFDDVDFLSHVEGSVNVHSPRISAALGSLSVPGVGPLSPVLESQPGASPSGSDRDVFADTGPLTTLPNGKLAVALHSDRVHTPLATRGPPTALDCHTSCRLRSVR